MAYSVFRDSVTNEYATGNCGGEGVYLTSQFMSEADMFKRLTTVGLDTHLTPVDAVTAREWIADSLLY